MKDIKSQISLIFLFAGLFSFGVFYHISSSEFWPVTISKTWLTPLNFEFSMLQKPLFTLFLSLFHLLPLNDVEHLYLVKCFFSFLGLSGFFIFLKSNMGNSRKISGLFFIIFLLPVFFHNFFRIRSDQVAFFLFSLMLWMISKKKHQLAFLILFFIPFFGIKEIIFWIPGLLLLTPFLKSKWQVQTWRFRIFVLGFMVTLLIWLIAFNVNAISYFLETFQNESFPGNHLKNYFEFEWPLILSSLVLIAISYQKEDLAGRCSLGAAILSLLLIISLPQSYPFYIASLCLIFYAPLIRFIYNNFSEKKNRLSVALLILVQILNILFFSYKEKFPLYTSSYQQFLFINLGSRIMTKYGFSYLDGMGIFPRQKFIPCFVSPEDLEANVGCLNRIKSHEAESIIVTQRLSFLGEEIFKLIAINYVQIRPNFWIEKKSINRLEKNEMDVLSGPLPILIFGF